MNLPAWLLYAVLFALPACRREPPQRPAITAVKIIVVPANGGSAEFEVQRNGIIRGAHLSGDATPFVHQDEGRLSRAVVDSLWRLVEPIDSVAATRSPPQGKGYAALQLSFANGSAWLTSWPDSAQAVDARVRASAAWLMAHRIGGW